MNSALSDDTVVVATKQQVSCDLGEETAILNMKNSVYYGLDPIGARIWHLLREPRSLGEIRDAILEEYDVTAERFAGDLRDLMEKLLHEGLVELSGSSR